jgi:hypothetical protein
VALQPEQELPPMEEFSPPSSLEKQAKRDNTLLAWRWHFGHVTFSLAWLIGRSRSNFRPHSGQTYSYIGIAVYFLLLLILDIRRHKVNFL